MLTLVAFLHASLGCGHVWMVWLTVAFLEHAVFELVELLAKFGGTEDVALPEFVLLAPVDHLPDLIGRVSVNADQSVDGL